MDGISATLLKDIRSVLLRCGPFHSDRQLSTTFVDERIAPWGNLLYEADSQTERVDNLISLLSQRRNNKQENALILFLQVVLDKTHPVDGCHAELVALIDRLQSDGRSAPQATESTPPNLNRFELYDILAQKFDLTELGKLAYFMDISLEDIPGGTRENKIRELIQLAERHSRYEELIRTIIKVRPNIFSK
jgi:hypothetical protein